MFLFITFYYHLVPRLLLIYITASCMFLAFVQRNVEIVNLHAIRVSLSEILYHDDLAITNYLL